MLALPDDILALVGDFVEDHWDCYNLIFVCRRFHDLFLRALYRSAALKSSSQTQSFLSAVLLRPQLALAVRSLTFDNWRPNIPSIPFSTSDNLALFSQWARLLSSSEEEHAQWEQDLLGGVDEAWMALLLPLVNNIRQLHLLYPRENQYLDRVLQRTIDGEMRFHEQPAFHALQQVSLSHITEDEHTKGSYLPSQIMPFFRLPSLRSFSADSVIECRASQENEQTQSPQAPAITTSSPISEITLNSSNGSQGMQTLIAACPSLKSFKYQHSDAHLLAEGYQPTAFYRSLATSQTTLQTLWLDNCGEHLPFTITGLNESHDEWFGPLTHFTVLKDLRIRLPNLLDVRYQPDPPTPLTEILPPSLESLYVQGCKENSLSMLLHQLELLLRERKKRVPLLQRLDIEGFFHDDEDDEGGSGPAGSGERQESVIKPRVYAMVESLRGVCAVVDVQFFLRDRACLQTMVGG